MSDQLALKAEVSVDDAGTITGIAWPFGSADRVGDVIQKGAFRLPPALPIVMEHDQNRVVGVWESATETDRGLEVKGRLFVEGIAPARQAYGLTRKGTVSGLSISFRDGTFMPLPNGGREFSDLTVTEISLCRMPVHTGARITSVKSIIQGNEMDPEAIDVPPAVANELKAVNDNFTQLTARLDKVETKLARPGVTDAKDGTTGADIERKALAGYIRTGSDVELKAAATDNGPDGGWFVLPTIDTSIRSLLTDLSPMRGLAEVVTIGGSVYERFYSLGKRGAQRVVERDDRPQDTARPELIKVSYGTGEYYAAPAATRHQIEDANVDIAGWLIENATHDFAETEGEDFLEWDGSNNFARG
ncbi:MAG: phage major capsid protein, partial [Vicinamibacterales bacterium]